MSLAFMQNYARIRKQMFPQCQPQPVVIPVRALPKPAPVIIEKPKPVARDVIDLQSFNFKQNNVVASFAPAYLPPGGDWHIQERQRAKEDIVFQFYKTGREILLEVAREYRVGINEVLSQRRDGYIVECRHKICWRVKNETALSLPQIAKILGGRDHTTILHGIRKYQHMIAENKHERYLLEGRL